MKITTETEISVKDYGSGVSTEKKEILFAKTLEQVKNTAKEQGNCISAQQVEEAFGLRVHPIVTVLDIHEYLKENGTDPALVQAMEGYMDRYCILP